LIQGTGLKTAATPMGFALATLILLGWLISMIGLLSLRFESLPWWLLLAGILVRTWLQTGLFITAHDAMHGVLLPGRKQWNDQLGALCLGLYAGLPYQPCLHKHHLHHSRTATEDDPDFHGDPRTGVLGWYLNFMAGYLSLAQMARLLGFWGLLVLGISLIHPTGWLNLLLFCTLPLLLSSGQLFVFGTYLPHRHQRGPGRQRQPTSLGHPPWLSLLTCFHFGYHREHHDHPQLAWFELPARRQMSTTLASCLTTRVASQHG
jgi:beta-carotene ketolase (CrtW type)